MEVEGNVEYIGGMAGVNVLVAKGKLRLIQFNIFSVPNVAQVRLERMQLTYACDL